MFDFIDSARVFAALGDVTRMAIVASLCAGGPRSIAALTSNSGVTRQAVTKHLEILAEAGLVHSIKCGRERIWEVDTHRFDEARRHLEEISKQWDEALGRLKRLVEDPD